MKLNLNGLSNFDYFGVLLLRLGAGALAIFHGVPTLIGGMEVWREVGAGAEIITLNPMFYTSAGFAAAIAQVFGGLFIIIGLFSRAAAIALAVVTTFAFANIIQSNEYGLIFFAHLQILLLFLSLVFIGPGRLSLDRKGI